MAGDDQWGLEAHGRRMLMVETLKQGSRLAFAWASFVVVFCAVVFAAWTVHHSVEELLDPLMVRRERAGEALTLAFLAFRGTAIAALVGAAVSISRRAFALLDEPHPPGGSGHIDQAPEQLGEAPAGP